MREAFGPATSAPVEPGWEDAWRRFHRPVRVGPLWVGPPWETPEPGALAVVIDPGQAFGTGAHPTTRLCLECLLGVEPGSLIDLGCGSGVLAVAAARLGFAPVTALDSDGAAVAAARVNAAANGVEVDVASSDALADPLPAARVVVANIALEAVEALGARVDATTLLSSGYLAHERPALRGWEHVERRELEGWAADRFERP
jgi:ribosomal protein L11 methyltransferase